MLRRLLLAIAVAAGTTLAAATPARAHTDTCVWTAQLITWGQLPTITVVPGPTVDFLLLPTTGTCPLTDTAPLMGGTMTGSVLGTTVGGGTSSGGHDFSFTGAAGTLAVTGEVAGTIRMTPDPLTSAGIYYIVQMSVTLLH